MLSSPQTVAHVGVFHPGCMSWVKCDSKAGAETKVIGFSRLRCPKNNVTNNKKRILGMFGMASPSHCTGSGNLETFDG